MENRIITLNKENYTKEGFGCVQNIKHEGFKAKAKWFDQRFDEGMIIKLMKSGKTTLGFIEYIPGEYAWRPVSANGYMFIHCIWMYKKDLQGKGYAGQLIRECITDAEKAGMKGVAVLTSDSSWIADKRVFLKNGFIEVEKLDKYELLVYKIKDTENPAIIDWKENLAGLNGLNLIFSNQCPYTVKAAIDLSKVAFDEGVELNVIELKSAKEVQNGYTGYGNFGIVYNGNLITDYYTSKARFKNILKKELKLI